MGKNLLNILFRDKLTLLCFSFIAVTIFFGVFAPYLAPNDPYQPNLLNKLQSFSLQYPLGTDHLGRCIASRLIYGIRITLFYAFLAMVITVSIGLFFGLIASFFKRTKEIILRVCDIMLTFPSELIMITIVGVLGTGIENIIIANVLAKVAWYIRMTYIFTQKHANENYILFAKLNGTPNFTILRKHFLPLIISDIIMLATLNIGAVILSISALSFLGLGVQAPSCEWGIMLNEAKNVMSIAPLQMICPGIMILLSVAAFNFLGDSFRDALDPNFLKKGDRGE